MNFDQTTALEILKVRMILMNCEEEITMKTLSIALMMGTVELFLLGVLGLLHHLRDPSRIPKIKVFHLLVKEFRKE